MRKDDFKIQVIAGCISMPGCFASKHLGDISASKAVTPAFRQATIIPGFIFNVTRLRCPRFAKTYWFVWER